IWDRDILLPAWLNGLHSIMSINAHFDHNRAQPAATDTGTSTLGEGLVTVGDVIASGPDTLTRGVIFSMGCHAGLSVSDVQISGGPVDPLVGPAADALERDWAQTFAEQGAVLAANTGYGYGDTEAVALSELLMTYFADNLDGSMSVGEALQYAKHRYASGALVYGAFDDKVLMQAVFYGLPMYAIGANPTTAPPVDPLPLGFDGVTGLTVASFDVELAIGSDLVETTTPRGSFFSVDGVTQVTPLRPIQPKVEIDATQPGDLIAHGAIITALQSFDQEPFDPVVSKATVDLAANEPEPGVIGSFPSALQAVNRYQTKVGLRDQLVLVPGQFRNTTETEGVQRLFTNLEGFVFYSPLAETDFKAPTITQVEGTGGAGGITFDVEVADTGSGIGRVYVLFKDPAAFEWVGLDLAPNGLGNWSGTAVGASGLKDYFVQAVDLAGNVAVSSNKAELFVTGNVPPPPPLVIVTGTETPGGWYVGSATVELDLPTGVTAVYDIDASGTFTAYTGPFTVSGDGPVDVVVQTSAGAFETITLFIDDAPPVVVSPLDGATFVKDEVVDYLFECIDASSGVVTCSGPSGPIDTSVAGTFSFSVTAIDEAANQTPVGDATITFTVLPDPPTVTGVSGNPGTVDEGTPVAFTASVADATTPEYQWQVLFNGGEVLTSTQPTLAFTALDDGGYEVRVRVRDAASGLISDAVSESFTADNVAPTIGLAGDATVDVGAPYTLTLGTVIDPGADNVGLIGVDWGDGTQDEYNGIGDVTHIYTTLGSRTITVDLIDDDGVWLAAATLDVEATEPPAITDLTVTPDLLSVADGFVDLEATFTGSVLTATIDWGDGTVEPATVAGTITGSHTYVTPEVHQVTLTLENSVGEIAVESYFVVVYDPLGASVKGNGEIELLSGTYFADPSITGDKPKPDDDPEAKFGINAKYKKDGDLNGDNKSKLKFKVLDLDIKSISYDWLVITGGLARYEGTLEFKDLDDQEFGFRITAIDGDVDDDDTYLVDEYGIQIWDLAGTIVFDTTHDGSLTRPLIKGKIKIKPPKDNPL
ncbi:MAG: PKD domain-containing protein, partial [Acidimicrobiia bacterium]|nr:PKD domain-containing protein [Acidimicrobiia bacterium]